MRIDIHHYFESGDAVLTRLEALANKMDRILTKELTTMSALTDALDKAEAAATANSAADDAAEGLLTTLAGLIADLKANVTDPAQIARIDALSTAIADRASKLSAAVVAGTPAA
jgi:hexokinase